MIVEQQNIFSEIFEKSIKLLTRDWEITMAKHDEEYDGDLVDSFEDEEEEEDEFVDDDEYSIEELFDSLIDDLDDDQLGDLFDKLKDYLGK